MERTFLVLLFIFVATAMGISMNITLLEFLCACGYNRECCVAMISRYCQLLGIAMHILIIYMYITVILYIMMMIISTCIILLYTIPIPYMILLHYLL